MARPHDVVVIGGGITGAGVARDCALRGLRTLLIERGRPAMGTTAASSHLVHGGLRYLLYDRLTTHTTCWDSGHIVRIARPLLQRLPIVWPVYRGHAHGIETVETLLEVYDGFSHMKEGRDHLRLTALQVLALVPGLRADGLVGAVCFDEWWVDPVALVQANLDSACRNGADVRTGMAVDGLIVENGSAAGVTSGDERIPARAVINASGPWVDRVASLAGLRVPLRLQKGTHLRYEKRLAPVGLLLEAVGGDRYIFVVPSPQGTLVGPTDLPAPADPDQVRTSKDEIDYLLACVRRYLPDFPSDYAETTVGSRPILGQAGDERLLSREYEAFDHGPRDGLQSFLTIGGGKMSDFRVMAQAVTDLACARLGQTAPCRTHLETLDGRPAADIPPYPQPPPRLKQFLRGHPRLREWHAKIHLGAAFARHAGRKLVRSSSNPAHALDDFFAYYEL